MTGLYMLAFERIKKLEASPKSEIIRFPAVFERLCSLFSITKEQAWEILFILRDFGFIEIVPYQGIRIKISINLNI